MENQIKLNKENDIDNSALNIDTSNITSLEESYLGQQLLYGNITPAPTKHKQIITLPSLNETLILPKQRRRSNTLSGIPTMSSHLNPKVVKRPSTCGKEGIRHFSTPLPCKIKSLIETEIPILSPDSSITDDATNSTFDSNTSLDFLVNETPSMNRKLTSPISVRSFSSPLSDLRMNSKVKSGVQLRLNQALSTDFIGESERQLKREVLKLQSEVDIMKKIKKYRKSEEAKNLDNLIDKWRNIAEMASNYIYNQAASKVSRMGGMTEFRKRQKKSKLRKMKFEFDEGVLYRLEEYMETEEYKNLDRYDQDELKSKKKELEAMSERIENGEIQLSDTDEDEGGNELTMKELYKQLGLDYDLVYG